MSRPYHTSDQDDEPLERLRGGRSDICDDGDRGGPPARYFGDEASDRFGNESGDRGQVHDSLPDKPMQQHEGGGLGWGNAAWDDAGGFESVLFGHLAGSGGPAGGFPPVIVFAIEDLNVEFNTLIQTTQIQNTLALLNASNGGSIDVGGDITAIGLQSASTENFAGFNLPDFA